MDITSNIVIKQEPEFIACDTAPEDSEKDDNDYDTLEYENFSEVQFEGSNAFTCPICGYVVNRPCHIKRHLSTHKNTSGLNGNTEFGDDNWICKICGRVFKYKTSYVKHYKSHSEEISVDSEVQSSDSEAASSNPFLDKKIFNEIEIIKITQEPFEKKKEVKNESLSCKICGREFKQRKHLTRHEKIHTGIKPYVCTLHNKRFTRKDNLTKHLKTHRSHLEDKNSSSIKIIEEFSLNNSSASDQKASNNIHSDESERKYNCQLCGFAFKREVDLKRHAKIHTGEKPFKCKKCKKRFTRKDQLTNHKNTHKIHSSDETSSSSEEDIIKKDTTDSDDDFNENDNIEIKMVQTKEKRYQCAECEKSFTTKKDLKRHINIHSGIKPFKCSQCDKCFGRKDNLLSHTRTHARKYKCKTCEEFFNVKRKYKRHLATHTVSIKYNCTICDYNFKTLTGLSIHATIHSEDKMFHYINNEFNLMINMGMDEFKNVCKICEVSFVNLKDLLKHSKNYHAVKEISDDDMSENDKKESILDKSVESDESEWDLSKTFKCGSCEAGFWTEHELKLHKETHLDKKIHYCHICQAGFAEYNKLVRHMSIHDQVKRFGCSFCEKRFNRKDNLNEHVKKHHFQIEQSLSQTNDTSISHEDQKLRNESESSIIDNNSMDNLSIQSETGSETKSLTCDFCKKRYDNQENLAEHIKLHVGTSKKCPYCDKVLARPRNLIRHLRTHTGEKPFSCAECGKGFSRKDKLLPHLRISKGCMKTRNSKKLINQEIAERIVNDASRNETDDSEHLNQSLEAENGTSDCKIRSVKVIKANRKDHMATHWKTINTYKCSRCEKMFNRKDKLSLHLEMHFKEKAFGCHLCGRSFDLEVRLIQHMKVHSKDNKDFSCEHCGKEFVAMRNLSRHLQIHSGIKPFECTICGKAFTRKDNLTEHMRNHSKVITTHKCGTCFTEFESAVKLKIHCKSHLSNDKFSSNCCGVNFSKQSHYNLHKRKYCENMKCTQCDKYFKGERNLKRHVLIHTGEKPFACELCEKRFNRRDKLTSHMRTH